MVSNWSFVTSIYSKFESLSRQCLTFDETEINEGKTDENQHC